MQKSNFIYFSYERYGGDISYNTSDSYSENNIDRNSNDDILINISTNLKEEEQEETNKVEGEVKPYIEELVEWTKREDELLISYVEILGNKWKFISKYFPNKTTLQVYNRYLKIDPKIKKGRFSQDEDKLIIEMIQKYGTNWSKISSILKDRSAKQIRYRYQSHLKQNFDYSDVTQEEKEIIFANYPILGNKWEKYVKLLLRKRSPTFIRRVLFNQC